jgi:diguanylate cyclase (GGDEF)-like protein
VTEYVSLALANQTLREKLRNQAIRDPLTGLYNRRFAEETLEREVLRAKRHDGSLSLIFLDVDHFKTFNDTYGHEAGDVVLQQLGVCVKEHVRGEDVACRYGGEEFLLILADTPIETALQRAEALREQFKARTIKFGSQYLGTVTLSLGVARFPDDGATPQALIAAADGALYLAKAGGRDRVVRVGAEA